MTDDTPRQLWSESDLDEALSLLHNETGPDESRLADTRALLLRAEPPPETHMRLVAAPSPRGTHRWRPVAAAVTALALMTGATVIAVRGEESTPVASRQSALDGIHATDPVLPEGQYLYIADRHWKRTNAKGTPIAYRSECLSETWSPGFGAADFGQTQTMTGRIQWISSTAQDAENYGLNPPPAGPASNAYYYCAPSLRRDMDNEYPTRWLSPRQAILDSLPHTAQDLLATLRHSLPISEAESSVFSLAGEMLGTGLYPASIRTRLYQALALLPQVAITTDAALPDGRTGTEFSLATSTKLFALTVDPRTGQLIGTRTTALQDLPDYNDISDDLKPGTVVDESVLTYGVSTKRGEKPVR
ncbi:hypothetical protein [Amycolatopsis minnesotensis]|uniref:CU044_5270 family protein n=1 Tax=Amycolatopsis minnesotensis TaxID=337894 RepID=A0ABN2Q4R2_9PSEU